MADGLACWVAVEERAYAAFVVASVRTAVREPIADRIDYSNF